MKTCDLPLFFTSLKTEIGTQKPFQMCPVTHLLYSEYTHLPKIDYNETHGSIYSLPLSLYRANNHLTSQRQMDFLTPISGFANLKRRISICNVIDSMFLMQLL